MCMKVDLSSHLLVHLIIYYMCHQLDIFHDLQDISKSWLMHQKYVAMKSCTNIYGLNVINRFEDFLFIPVCRHVQPFEVLLCRTEVKTTLNIGIDVKLTNDPENPFNIEQATEVNKA